MTSEYSVFHIYTGVENSLTIFGVNLNCEKSCSKYSEYLMICHYTFMQISKLKCETSM
jgi:hypothetical protein